LAVLLLMVGAAGCGRTGTVSGTVKYKGQLLPLGLVVFYNSDNKQVASAAINPDGTYTAEKVPAGQVKITVTTPRPIAAGSSKDVEARVERMKKGQAKLSNAESQELLSRSIPVPPEYADPVQSPLTLTVAGGPQTHDMDLP
jgi:hypothetical protein